MKKVPDYTKRAKESYRKSILTVSITVNPRTEQDVYKKLLSEMNKSGYIKKLIGLDIAGGFHE